MQQEDPHFHSIRKGCRLRRIRIKCKYTTESEIVAKFCDTHGVEICRCGFEFGYHFGDKAQWKPDKKEKINKNKNELSETRGYEAP